MKLGITLTAAMSLIIMLGAGCKPSDSPYSLDKYQLPETDQSQNETSTEAAQTVPDSQNTDHLTYGEEQQTPTSTTASSTSQSAETAADKPENESENLTPEKPMPETQTPEILTFPGVLPEAQITGKQIRIKTNKGDIVFEILGKEGPKAASNFVYLTERGFYNGLTFHRVEPGFVIQGGDPNGNGTGGPGYKFEDDNVNLSYNEGIVAMANAGANTNGSQFFIMLADNPLPPKYSIFGRVKSGMEVVKQITRGDVMNSVTIEPLQ